MLSASTRFAVPEKILKRSSFTKSYPLRPLCAADFCNRGICEETLRLSRRAGLRWRALDQTNVPGARDCLANEGLIVRKPDSGSARQRWARENSKHRRTATRQRGFRRSSLE